MDLNKRAKKEYEKRINQIKAKRKIPKDKEIV